MAVCEYCGKRFNMKKAKEEFKDHFEASCDYWEYDDTICHVLCAECAINDANEGMSSYNLMAEYYECDD